MENSENPFEGAEVIHSYMREQALEDGVLVDLAGASKEAGFKFPVAVTRAVWSLLDCGEELKAQGQSWQGRAWDMLTILRYEIARGQGGELVLFAPLFIRAPGQGPEPVQLKAVCGPGDRGEPVVTIMYPDED